MRREVNGDWLHEVLGRYENKPTDGHAWGKVASKNEDGSYQVVLNGAGAPTRCANGVSAEVGDIVLVLILANGKCVAMARKGGEAFVAESGATFYPYVDESGNISWTNDKGLVNPDPVNIKGVGVATMTAMYAASSSGDTPPTEWSETPPTLSSVDRFLWSYDVTTYTDGEVVTTDPRVIGAYGEKGDAGEAGESGISMFGTSSTGASTAAKAATVPNFALSERVSVAVRFYYANTAANPTLDVEGTGAYPIMLNGSNAVYWQAGATVGFAFDGTYWQVFSTPIYGSTATIGNPATGNVYVDGTSVNVRQGTTVLAKFASTLVQLGMNAKTSVIELCGGRGKIRASQINVYNDYNQIDVVGKEAAFLQVDDASAYLGVLASEREGDTLTGSQIVGDAAQINLSGDMFTFNSRMVATVSALWLGSTTSDITISNKNMTDYDLLLIVFKTTAGDSFGQGSTIVRVGGSTSVYANLTLQYMNPGVTAENRAVLISYGSKKTTITTMAAGRSYVPIGSGTSPSASANNYIAITAVYGIRYSEVDE